MAEARIIELDSPTALPVLTDWTSREDNHPPASPFQRHDVMTALHAIHTPDRRLILAVTDENGDGRSILPYALTRRQIGPFPFRLIEGPVSYHASVADFAVSGGEALDRANASALLASPGWDLLEFRGVSADSALAHAFAATDCAIVDDHDAHTIPLHDGALMSSKRGRNQRRLCRRMSDDEGITVTTRTPDDVDWPRVVEAYATLHTARWRGTDTPSALADPATRGRLIARLSGTGTPAGLWAITLENATTIRGVVLAWDSDTEVHAWRLAYDIALAPYSPGLQLLQGLAEAARAHGKSLLRLGRGDDAYKESWNTVRVPQVIIRGVSESARVRLTGALARLVGRAPFSGWRR